MPVIYYRAISMSSFPVLLSFALGVLAHLTLFRYGEWDMKAKTLCAAWLLTYTLLFFLFVRGSEEFDFLACLVAMLSAQRVLLAHVFGIITSMTIYRCYFHRLCVFPGHFLARVSGWYHTYVYARRVHLYEELQLLHKRYGQVVRVAPSALSVAVADAIPLIYSGNSTCSKGPFFNIPQPRPPINFERSLEVHAQRRKEWDHAFSIKALKSYEPMISVHVARLLSYVDENTGKPMDIAKKFKFTVFELITQLAFGKTFTAQEEPSKRFYMDTIIRASATLGYFAYVPWFIHVLMAIPGLAKSTKQFRAYGNLLVRERRNIHPELRDIFSWMLDNYENSEVKTLKMEQNLHSDAITITLAGTETTTAALTAMIHYLSQHPKTMEKLRNELVEIGFNVGSPDYSRLSKAPYLNACINETLRMSPPTASQGYYRQTPPEGLQVSDIHIPGDVTVIVPQYVMNHDLRFWKLPDDFIPERWTDRPELVKDGSVFNPFGLGPYGCVGKFLARTNIRAFTASLLLTYDIAPAPGQTQTKFYEAQRDNMTISYDSVQVVFTKRQ